MSTDSPATVHASAVVTGRHAVLIRGRSGAGKSRLARSLLDAAQRGDLRFAQLIGDDRVILRPSHGRLLVSAPPALAGLIEVRGLGIRRLAVEPVAVVGLIVDLAADDAERMPDPEQTVAECCGIRVRRLAVSSDDAMPLVLAALRTEPFDVAMLRCNTGGHPG